jgi:hypothetical protein
LGLTQCIAIEVFLSCAATSQGEFIGAASAEGRRKVIADWLLFPCWVMIDGWL